MICPRHGSSFDLRTGRPAQPAGVRAGRDLSGRGRGRHGAGGGGRELKRCWETTDPLYNAYHDEEWGRPVTTEQGVYERLCLEGFQSGLSWITILRKREAFRAAFEGFDPERVARFDERDVERLLGDASIVRHRGKIEATIANARATVELRAAGTPLDELFWSHGPESHEPSRSLAEMPLSDAGVGGALEEPAARGLPLRRPDDRLRGHAGLRRRQRPRRGLLGAGLRRGRAKGVASVLTHPLDCGYPRKGGGPALETSSTGSGGTSS